MRRQDPLNWMKAFIDSNDYDASIKQAVLSYGMERLRTTMGATAKANGKPPRQRQQQRSRKPKQRPEPAQPWQKTALDEAAAADEATA